MPGGNFNGANFKQALITAAPMFNAMAAGYSSGRGPYAYMDQGALMMQENIKRKRDEEAKAAASAAFGGLMAPGGLGGAMGGAASRSASRASAAPVTFNKNAPQYIADDAMAALGKSPMSMEGKIREGLKARGMPEHVANAFIVNFQDESNLNPGINEAAPLVPGSRGGFGLAQWTGPRRRALEAFAAETGRPVDDLNVQLDFLMQELQGPEARAGEVIMSAKTAPEAAAAIVNDFLRPAEVHRSRREAEYLGMDPGQPAQADPMADPYVQQLMQVMAMPGLTPEQKSVVELQLQSRIQTITAPNPAAEEEAARARRARDAELLGYQRGSPEWTQYVVTGQQPEAAKPLEVGDVLLDPNTYQPIYDGREPGARPMTAQERAAWGIPETDTTPYKMTDNGPVAIGGGGTSVTVDMGGGPELGKLSTDYGYVLDPATGMPKIDPATGLPMAAPVPGSPAAREAEAAAAKTDKRDTQAAATANIVLEDINKAIDQTSGWTAGVGSILAGVPGSGAADLQATIDTIVANIGFDRLQAMREASPTGGALGGIAVPELMMLQAVLGSLKTQQSPPQLKANLERLRQVYEPIAAKAAAYPNAAEFGFVPTSPQGATAPITGTTSGGVQWSIE